MGNFPRSIRLGLPRIITTVLRRESLGGRYSRSHRKEQALTHGLTAEQGLYSYVQIKVDTMEQTLTTDMLNYIVIVVKLFMKEIKEVIQKMAGDDQHSDASRHKSLLPSRMASPADKRGNVDQGWLLSETVRGRAKFTVRIRVEEFQLMATTRSGAIKLEAKTIDVELTNRVSQTGVASDLLHYSTTHHAGSERSRLGPVTTRPSHLRFRSTRYSGDAPLETIQSSGDSLFIYATIARMGAELGYLDQDLFFKERSPEFRTVAFFKTSLALRSLLANEKFASLSSAASRTTDPTLYAGEHDAFLISLNTPTLWLKPFTVDRAILMWMVYKSEFAKWKDYMDYLSSMTSTDANTDRPMVSDKGAPPTNLSTKYATKPRSQVLRSVSPVSSRAEDTLLGHTSDHAATPISSDASHKSVHSKSTSSSGSTSTLFLQLNVEDLGVCLPINITQSNVQSSRESDFRTALVLTLDQSRVSACYRDSLVSQGEFTDFCLRFDDEFNVGSDEWKPDWKRASIDVHGKRRVVILNSCVVPNGTFSVSWHNPEKYAQWNLIIRWQMRGLDFHFDDNVGRRLKALVSILTRITGYNGAAPLLPTSAEEEDESCGKGSTSHIAPVEQVDQESSAVAAPSQEPPKGRPRTEPIHHALSDSHDQRGAYSDIASLDRYVPASVPPASTARSFAPDLAQVRSMEIHKHKQELLDAQHCLAFKRQKWGTLRRKKGTASVSTNAPQSPNLTYTKSPPAAANERWDSESQPTTSSNWARSMSIGCGRLPTDSRFVGYSSPANLTHNSTTETATFGSAGLLELNSNRISLASKNGSVYFDADAGDVSNTVSTSMQQFGSASTFETASLGTIQTFDGVVRQPGNKRTDSWFNALQTNDFELTASGNEDVRRVDMDDFVVGQEQDESCSSDEADETIMEPNWPDTNRMAPPPPPPRQNYVPPPNETAHLVSQPQVQLKLDVQIHVDSGCCVLHPRITPPNGNDNPFPPTHTIDSARPQYFSPPSSRFQTPNTTGFRQCSDSGVRFSNSDFLPLYLERYKRHLLEDIQYLTTDLSVFLLPAVDVGLHYHSMTEMGFHSAIASTLPSLSAPRASNAAPSATFFSRQASFQHLATKVHLRDAGDESECVRRGGHTGSIGDEQAVTDGREDDDPRLLCGSGGLKKQTDLYVSCFLQKLPKEWVVHPALLDFLEQALEDLPFVADVDVENAPPSTGDNNTLNQDPKPSTSSLSFNDSAWETFPVHAVVHLRMQPFTARFLCLPTSRMQCLLILPFMDVVFSTNRDSDQPTGTSEVYPPSKDGGPKTNDPDQHYSLPAGRTSHQFALQATEDTVGPVCTLRLPPNPKVGDIVSQGGLCVTAILKEFRISVFHPYVDSASARSERILGATWTGDSLTLLVHDARLNISRRVETTLVRLDHIARSFDTDPAGGGVPGEPNAKPALSRNASASASRSRAMAATSTCPPPLAESWGLHRDVKFSGVFDVGVAVFTCDTRRTLEILDIPNAWYRGSFVRRLFLGNTEPTADAFNEMDRTNEPGDLPHSPLKAAPEAADDFVVAVDPIPTTSAEPFSPTRSHYWSLTSPPLLSATDSDQQMEFDAFAPPVERTKLHTLPQPPDATKERRPIDSSNLVSQSTTLLLERGPNTSPSASLRVASWHALPIICFHLKRFDLSLFMGSAMGQTRFVMDQLFCNGRMSLHSSGRKNTTLSAGLGTCQFVSEGGGVGGEMALLDVEARVHLNQAPDCDPQHSLNARIDGFQLRVEYMNTNVLLMRLNSLYLSLQDEWQLREAARQLVARLQTNFAQSGSQSTALRSTHMSAPVKFTLSDDGVTGVASGSALKTPTVETDVGAPPICIRVVGDISWDQAQVAIVRTTTPDLIHSYSKVREYFEEQVREGRNSLIGRGGSFQMFSTSTSGRSKPLFRRQAANGTEEFRKQQQRDLIDRLLQRHWQSLLRDSINFYTHQLANFDCTDDPLSILNACGIDRLFPVMGGSLQLSGRSLGVACYAGSLRSAPDWAVFNIQYPTVCFETEAQREPLASGVTPPDPLESDGWINVRQVLSFDLISRPEYQPQMAYVIRVRRGSQPITRNPPILTIEEWLEFTFRGADNTVTNFVRSNDPGSLPSVVQLSQFPARFPASIPATSPLMTVERSHFSRHQHLETVHENIPSRYVSTVHPPGSGSKPPWPSASVQGSSDDATKQAQPPTHSNPLKPPTEGEIIFILPSISLRITTDQRQPMAQPTLSSLSSISAEKKKSSPPPSPFTDEPDHPHSTPTPAKSTGSWLYGHKAATTPDSTDESEPVSLGQMHDGPGKRVATHAPSVKVSFQTDFHGFIQLGLIDVSWLPTLINSYLKERLQDYEDSTFATPSYRTSGDPTSQDADLTKCLRELASTSSPMVQDARTYEVIHWSFSPVCRWLLASNICVPAFDRLLARVGFQKARTTIPKWLQRGLMDHLDRLVAVSLHACMRLVPEQQSSTSLKPVPSICHVETTDDTVDHTPRSHTESPTHQAFPTDFAYRPH
ncbi:unnamed protein product [Dicrocoelium dendriticum]|nr:unnamed protein product [Dicrocoelium dendriticum]